MTPAAPHGPLEGTELHRLQLSREADDWQTIPGLGRRSVLRASIGGTDEIGYYLNFRGDPRAVVRMLELVTEVARQQLPSGRYRDLR